MGIPRRWWRHAFDPSTARGKWGIFGALLVFVGITWTLDTLLGILGADFGPWFTLIIVVLVTLAGVALLSWSESRAARARRSYHGEPPARARGLILSLSTFNGRDSTLTDHHALDDRLRAGALTAADEAEIARTNWGPLYVAARHHAPTLEHCWLLCSMGKKGSYEQLEVAERLIQQVVAAAGRGAVEVHPEPVADVSDPARVAHLVDEIYDEAIRRFGLRPEEIVADITGGTAAMSAGITIAVLPENRRLQYLRQDVPLVVDGRLLSAEELAKKKVLLELQVDIGSFPKGVEKEVL